MNNNEESSSSCIREARQGQEENPVTGTAPEASREAKWFSGKKVDISQERLKEVLHYDPDTGVIRWRSSGREAGYNHNGYRRIRVDGVNHYAHRLAWIYQYGSLPPCVIDHINHDRSDNRISNLREATQGQNNQNKISAMSHNKLGILGVSYYPKMATRKWRSGIKINGKKIIIGYFSTMEEARDAYLEYKRKHHEFCTL